MYLCEMNLNPILLFLYIDKIFSLQMEKNNISLKFFFTFANIIFHWNFSLTAE